MVTCTYCGQANEPGKKFCRFCGHPLSDASVAESVPRWEGFISVLVDAFQPEMVITAIAWYMVVLSILYILNGIFSLLLGTFGNYLMNILGFSLNGSKNIALLTISGWIGLFIGIISGAAATGLFRSRSWALGTTRIMLIIISILWFISLLLTPNISTAIGTIVNIFITLYVWVYFEKPNVRSYLDRSD
jgi:hypothetical protein